MAEKKAERNGAIRDTKELKFRFEVSGNETYWSTMNTMKSYVNNILAPYFASARAEHGDPEDQLAIWQIDAWSVHRSAEFCEWMKSTHPSIQLDYVPGGCTGLWQPCDVGIQRLLKHELRRASRADIVEEALQHLESKSADFDISAIQLDKRVGVLRDRSVAWIVKAFEVINHKDFVQKAFEHCQLESEPHINLSHSSLTSSAALQALKNLPKTDPELWTELMQHSLDAKPPVLVDKDSELTEGIADEFADDDLAMPSSVLRDHLSNSDCNSRGFVKDEKGNVVPASIAETLDDEASDSNHEFAQGNENTGVESEAGAGAPGAPAEAAVEVELGRGQRSRVRTKRYADPVFWLEH